MSNYLTSFIVKILLRLSQTKPFILYSILCIWGGVPHTLSANPTLDSLYRQSKINLNQAIEQKGNIPKQMELARKAAEGFEILQQDSFFLEAKFLISKLAYYSKDSLTFENEIAPIFRMAFEKKDTNIIVRAYNLQGSFYFTMGDSKKGMEVFKTPDRKNYYAANAVEESVFNLGGLIDIEIGYTMNLDTVYYYVNKLQQLAKKYPNPSIQVVSRSKLSQLFLKALNYEESLKTLREAYPYLGDLNSKGIAHYFYRNLINTFINLEMPDSANHYIDILQEAASYEANDPRNCYAIVSKTKANKIMGKMSAFSEEFELCYDRTMETLERTKKAGTLTLDILFIKCYFFLAKKNWPQLDKHLSLLIEYATVSKNNIYLFHAYEIQYKSLIEKGLTKQALEAHIKFKEYSDKINKFVFSQSQTLIRNQLNLQLTEEENKVLQIENQNQKLRIVKERSIRVLFFLGFLLLGLLVTYLVHLSRVRARQSNELARLVKEKTTQLEATNETLTKTNKELVASNSELERFTFIASHDLKTPLHNIIKFADLISRKLKVDNEDIKDYLSFIINGGKRMNTLIEDVLEYSKFSKLRVNDQKTVVNTNKLLNEISNLISEYFHSQNASLEIKSKLPNISSNYSKLFILFKNLIENGIKYNTSLKPCIKIYHENGPEGCFIYFEDNGIGIEDEYSDKVFQMFYRLHNHTAYEGSGLGLAMCKKIVEDMGGTISFTSQLNVGSIFKIKFPTSFIVNSIEYDGIQN